MFFMYFSVSSFLHTHFLLGKIKEMSELQGNLRQVAQLRDWKQCREIRDQIQSFKIQLEHIVF